MNSTSDVYGGRPSGFILWFTGLSGAGKSTLSRAVRQRLAASYPVEVLDGDEVRTFLSRGLGFSKSDRDENIRRIGYAARLLARHRVAVIVAAISPYQQSRDDVRRMATEQGIPFLEIYVQARLEVLVQRDVKGLYKKALAGELPNFTGVSDPYEPPEAPELTIQTDTESPETAVARIIELLRGRDVLKLA